MAEAFLKIVIDNLSSLIKEEIGLMMGVDKEMKKLSNTLTTIQAVVEYAEINKLEDVQTQNWLRKLNDLTYEIDDILDECQTEVSKLRYSSGVGRYGLKKILYQHKIGRRMKQVTEKLNDVAADRAKLHLMPVEKPSEVASIRETGSVLNQSHQRIYGREEDRDKIVDILVNHVKDNKQVSVLPIVGVGGLGKTTLAQLIFNDPCVVEHFEKRIWVCVSDNFDVKTLIKAMIDSGSGMEGAPNLVHLDSLQRQLWDLLNQKRYLLVLDDVWNEHQEKWEALRKVLPCGSCGASIVVTTRMKKVAEITGTLPSHYSTKLSDEHCWMLLRERAFGQEKEEYPNLEVIGKQIVKKCVGVPLAAKALGGLLRFKRTEEDWIYVKESELWALPQDETSILPALKLSYHHLPLELRQCFVYCAAIPKDSRIWKDELIFYWMAHGYISSTEALEVEEVGNEICNELVLRSLLQDVSIRERTAFNMHDLVHDLAQSIMLNKDPGTQAEGNVPSASNRQIREIVLQRNYNLFPKNHHKDMHSIISCTSLRVLDTTWKRIKDLPSAIGNLKHLRYLNLSSTKICSLPNSLCSLWNLKILILNECKNLVVLPKKMRYLKNLRHLFLESCKSLKQMPSKIGELTCLRTLGLFIVGCKKGNQLEELQFLSLSGKLEIRHLERVKNAMDAKKANLAKKKDLRHLELIWMGDDASEEDERVLEALEPHPNLEALKVVNFNGKGFPLWMSALGKVVRLDIRDCKNCLRLPQWGELPQLKELRLVSLVVEYIFEDEFTTVNNPRSLLFPTLEELDLRFLPNLKGIYKGTANVAAPFPKLRRLDIQDCSSLILPPLSSLEWLTAIRCSSSTMASLPKLHTLTRLLVEIDKSMMLSFPVEMLENLTNLEILIISGEDDEHCMPEEGMRALKSLKHLMIRNSNTLTCLPEGWVRHLSTLEEIFISDCREFVELPEGIKYLHSLKLVRLFYLPKMVCLPEALRHLSTLEWLILRGLTQLSSLPDWLDNLTSLQRLSVIECPQLASLPDSIRRMVNLKDLHIEGCPELIRQCEKEKGEDWPKISHIPHLEIGW